MIARLHCRANLRIHEYGAHWQATCQRLREREQIRLDARTLVCKEVSGTTETTLHFVEDQCDATLASQRAKATEKLRLEDSHTALALNGLDNDGGDRLGVEQGVEILE